MSKGKFRHFLGQARGSLIELETQVFIGGNLGYLNPEAVTRLLETSGEVSRLLHGLIKSLQPDQAQGKNQRLERARASSGYLETQKPETRNYGKC